jgi:ribosomal protein S6--L-glutamate ligase
MHFALLARPDGYYARDLVRAATARGHRATVCPFSGLSAALPTESLLAAGEVDDPRDVSSAPELRSVDAVIVRTMPPGSLEQVVFRMNALARLERRGVVVVNSPRAVECAVDKYLTSALLADAGLRVPRTVVCETAEAALLALEQLGGDALVKPLFGSEGRGIVRVSDPDLAHRVFRAIERTGGVLYVQEFVPHPGWDLRVMVLDGRVLGGMRRHARDDYRTNVSLGGRAEVVAVGEREAEVSVRAAMAVGARIAGVDLLYRVPPGCKVDGSDPEPYVLEVNGVPGWKAFREATGLDVADRLVAAIEASPRTESSVSQFTHAVPSPMRDARPFPLPGTP